MRTYDLSPLHRFTVGFDRMSRLLDTAARLDETASSYPPYNIEKHDEDTYRVSLAVAGFREGDLTVTVEDGSLLISGRIDKSGPAGDETVQEPHYLHHGIATRAFERRFQLADHIKVTGATLENGLLHVALVREVPEEKKPRRIDIAAGQGPRALPKGSDSQKAA